VRIFKKIDKFLSENTYIDNSGKTFWGAQGAGVLPIAEDTGRLLIAHRSTHVNEPGTYGVWGGAIDPGEDPKEAARRELSEEAAYRGRIKLIPAHVYTSPGGDFKYHNFIGIVESEFDPRLDWETQGYKWVTYIELLDMRNRLHFGLEELIDRSSAKILQHATVSESVECVSDMIRTFQQVYGSNKAVMWVLDVPRNDSFSWSERVVLDRLDSAQIDRCRKSTKKVRAAVVSARDVESHWTQVGGEHSHEVVLSMDAKPRELNIEEVELALSATDAGKPLSSLESSRFDAHQ